VTLSVTYYHRCQCPQKAVKNGRRGLFPMLMLLGIAGHFTPQMRKRMAKAAALLGSYEEAVEMLEEEGLVVSVNQLRDVAAGMAECCSGSPVRARWPLREMPRDDGLPCQWTVAAFVCVNVVEEKTRKGENGSPQRGVNRDSSSFTRSMMKAA